MNALHHILTATLLAGTATAMPTINYQNEETAVPVAANQLLIRPTSNMRTAQIRQILSDYGFETPRNVGNHGWLLVSADAATSEQIDAILTELRDDFRIDGAAANAIMAADGGALVETDSFDPHRDLQWNIDLIDVEAAQEIAGFGSSDVVVAILDSGVAWRNAADGSAVRHPDFAHTRFVAPIDFVDGDHAPDDELYHGTHVAGIIAAGGRNGEGVLGVAPSTAIMPIRVLDHEGIGTLASLVAGIEHAVDFGADVINLSLSFTPGYRPGAILADAISDAWEAGVVIVASTGNYGLRAVPYPAAYNEVIAVGAVGPEGAVTNYSNFGSGIDIVAPGGRREAPESGVLSACIIDGDPTQVGYGWASGTSQAAPHVAATAALLIAQGVGDPLTLRNMLEGTAADFGREGWDILFGAGLVDPFAALTIDVPVYELSELGGWNSRPEVTLNELALAVLEELILDLLGKELRAHGGLLGHIDTNGGLIGFMNGNGGLIGIMNGNGAVIEFMTNNGGLLGHMNNNGGLLGLLTSNGGLLGLLTNNGGLLGHMNNNGGLLGLINNNGGLLGLLNSNGGLLGMIAQNGGLVGFMNNNGGLLGLLNNNGGLLGTMQSNGSGLRPLQ